MGEHTFGCEAKKKVDLPNRDLFTEFCMDFESLVANTLFQHPVERKATYHEPAVRPGSPITDVGFNMLDILVAPAVRQGDLIDVKSDTSATLASHHFPVHATIVAGTPVRAEARSSDRRKNWAVLRSPSGRRTLTTAVRQRVEEPTAELTLTQRWRSASASVMAAVNTAVPDMQHKPNKPWISEHTLELIAQRRQARAAGDWGAELRLRKSVKQSAKQDRTKWLENLTATGDWGCIKKISKRKGRPQGRLHNKEGVPVATDERAETFAEHLSSIQWHVRPATLTPDLEDSIYPPMNVNQDSFTDAELRRALRKLRTGKACKRDDIPAEVYKALAAEPGQLQWLLEICNIAWASKSLPEDWCESHVSLLFKKGDPASCDNYRPLSLQCVAMKVFSAMLKERLLDAGVDERLWASQFGFRTGRSTEHAIYIARRRIETARAKKGGAVTLVALDWKKAFDSIHIESLIDAMRRLGIPSDFREMVRAMMVHRMFVVR